MTDHTDHIVALLNDESAIYRASSTAATRWLGHVQSRFQLGRVTACSVPTQR